MELDVSFVREKVLNKSLMSVKPSQIMRKKQRSEVMDANLILLSAPTGSVPRKRRGSGRGREDAKGAREERVTKA
ncbi:hypothetical protein CR513_63078, partial [Mucuna pruriens]